MLAWYLVYIEREYAFSFHILSALFSLCSKPIVDIYLTENVSLLQVKYVFEAFKKLRPGIPLMCLYGRMKQDRRMAIYAQFCEKRSVLFCTDVASRGLDFNKAVDWVVQVKYLLFKEATFALDRKCP